MLTDFSILSIQSKERSLPDRTLTQHFANAYKLPIDNDGYLSENPKSQSARHFKSRVCSSGSVSSCIEDFNIDGLEINRLGRFSNALIQISNAITIAKKLHINRIFIPRSNESETMFSDREEVCINDLKIIIGKRDLDIIVLEGSFFYIRLPVSFSIPDQSRYDIIQEFKEYLDFDFSIKNTLKDDEIVIHIRSGDIFQKHPNPEYGQPPLSYYQKIIGSLSPNLVYLVYEDESNPVINALKESLSEKRIRWIAQSDSLQKDIALLLRAKTIVSGAGSFIPGIVALSENIQSVYTFQDGLWCIQNPKVKVIKIKDRIGDYRKTILKDNWMNSIEQRQLMLDYPMSALMDSS